jgi:hypothetical protein
MKSLSVIRDNRIKAANILVEISMKDYLNVANEILNENDFQRKRVINSQISNLIREDVMIGCSVPALVLALNQSLIPENFNYLTFNDDALLQRAFDTKQLLILDGKQRTHVFSKLYDDLNNSILKSESDIERAVLVSKLKTFLENKLRIEIYVGISKLNILYRMLTLNSGQTSMSTRHLMEMLYLDYLKIPIDGIKLIADKDNQKIANDTSEFTFKEILDGFTSYLDRDENTLERSEILDNIKSAKNLKHEDDRANLFEVFVKSSKLFLDKIIELSEGYVVKTKELAKTEFEIKGLPFGTTALEIFKKSQSISGFGAAVAELKEIRADFDLNSIATIVPKLKFSNDSSYQDSVHYLLKHFENIKDKSKKIGNDQRFYFKYFFRYLFDKEVDFPFCIDKAVEFAYKKLRDEKAYLPEVTNNISEAE